MAQKRKDKAKKRVVAVDANGQAHIQATFNNIIISLTNGQGQKTKTRQRVNSR